MMRSSLLSVLVLGFSLIPVQAEELSGTLIARAAGDAPHGDYRNGFSQEGKGNFGFANDVNVKSILIFDALPVLEELAEEPGGEMELAFDWNKNPELIEDVKVIFVGAYSNIEVKDTVFRDFYTQDGVEVAEISAEELVNLPSRKMVNLELEEVAPGGDASPSNRYLVYRLEMTEGPDEAGVSNMVGLSPEASAHKLYLGEGKRGAGGGGGGYLKN